MHYSEIFNLRWSDVDHYRIPSLIVTKKGTVLAFCNNRRDSGQDHAEQVDLICLRKPLFGEWEEHTLVSHEGWSCHIGSASYDGASGDVMCTFGRSAIPIHEWKDYTDEERRQIQLQILEKAERDGIRPGSYILRSADDGESWVEAPFDQRPARVTYTDGTEHDVLCGCHGSSHGIVLQHGEHRGRIVCPSRFSIGKYSTMETIKYHSYNNCVYSDDGGRTWQASRPVQIGTGEGTLA